MTIELEITISADATSLYITDKSVYESYATHAYYLIAERKSYDADQRMVLTQTVTGDHSDPQNIVYDAWSTKVIGDGWHRFSVIEIDLTSKPALGSNLEVAWKEYLQGGSWKDEESFTYEGTTINFTVQRQDCFLFPVTSMQMESLMDRYFDNCNCDQDSREEVMKLFLIQNGSERKFLQGEAYNDENIKYRAQWMIESYLTNCI